MVQRGRPYPPHHWTTPPAMEGFIGFRSIYGHSCSHTGSSLAGRATARNNHGTLHLTTNDHRTAKSVALTESERGVAAQPVAHFVINNDMQS